METGTDSCARELRKMAGNCRRMANGLSSAPLARQLEEIADDYERDADRLEANHTAYARTA